MLNVARLWKLIPAVPIIKLLPGERTHERVITHGEESEYLGAAPLLLRQFATVMLDTAMCPEVVCRMRWEHVHLDPLNGARFGYIHNPKGKTKLAKRNLSLTARVQSLLNMRHEEGGKPATGWVFPSNDNPSKHVPYSTVDSQHSRTIEKLNAEDSEGHSPNKAIVPFRLYDLRHTALTRLGEVNTDPYTLQRIAGHSSILISQRYVHPTPERLEDAFARLETYNQAKVSSISETMNALVN
jgi:integrase